MTDELSGQQPLGQPRYFCRGCGLTLPIGFRGHFHRDCLRADKRRRISERRRREQDRFERLLGNKRCQNCGTSYANPQSGGATDIPCEASQPTKERDSPPS